MGGLGPLRAKEPEPTARLPRLHTQRQREGPIVPEQGRARTYPAGLGLAERSNTVSPTGTAAGGRRRQRPQRNSCGARKAHNAGIRALRVTCKTGRLRQRGLAVSTRTYALALRALTYEINDCGLGHTPCPWGGACLRVRPNWQNVCASYGRTQGLQSTHRQQSTTRREP